jgi:hypothetical protein
MILIPESYYKEEKIVKLTQQDIDMIVEELERQPHNVFLFLNYDKLIEKLKSQVQDKSEKVKK